MTIAQVWTGTELADRFVFDSDGDRFDFVLGGHGDDYISDGADDGLWSSDVFRGKQGNDTLISLDGHDELRGGQGDDLFEVTLGFYDPSLTPGVPYDGDPMQIGFDVEIRGGKGFDHLVIHNSDGHTLETDGNALIIHSIWGGTVTVRGVEEITFL